MEPKLTTGHVLISILFFSIVAGILNSANVTGMGKEDAEVLRRLPYTFDFDGPAYPEPNLVFDGVFPKVPERMVVYSVKEPNVTEASVRELAARYFDMPPDAELTRSHRMGLYWLNSGNRLVEVNPLTGSFNVAKVGKQDAKMIDKNYPSKEEAQNIAQEYLKSRGLLPKDAYLWRVVSKPARGLARVGYLRKIGNYKTYGAGAKIHVKVGREGEVRGVRKTWQELIPYKAYPIKSPEDALAELQSGKGVLMNGDTGKVKEITLRYYTSPQKQEYVQPIYYFDCKGRKGSFRGIVPAIKDEYLRSKEETFKKRKKVRTGAAAK